MRAAEFDRLPLYRCGMEPMQLPVYEEGSYISYIIIVIVVCNVFVLIAGTTFA